MMKNRFFTLLAFAISLLGVIPCAMAAKAPQASQKQEAPLEVTAENSLEWYQDKKIYVARGKAKAIKGSMTIEADILTAHQRDEAKKPSALEGEAKKETTPTGDIDWLTADNKVHIFDEAQQIFGDHAVYHVDEHLMSVTGKNLKYQTAYEVVTARDSMDYDENQNIAVAKGKAVAVHQKTPADRRQIEGDILTAQFTVSPEGKKELTQLFADGHVTVITKTDISRGDHAVYDTKQNTAVLTGHVKITHGTSQLAGDQAETDFASGHSRLIKTDKKRARAFVPPKTETSATEVRP